MSRRPRRLVARHRRPPVRGLPAGPARLRAHALPALHVGDDGQAQGHHAHDRGLPARAPASPTRWSSTSSPTTSTGAPPTSAGSPATATSSTGRSRTRRPGSCTRARPTRRRGSAGGRSSRTTRSSILYCAPTAIRAHMKQGPQYAAEARPLARCASSARSASRSTPRRGCGTTSTSAAARPPIVDTWWQTETGMIMITPLPGVTDHEAGQCHVPVPGHRRGRRRRRTGTRVPLGGGGYLVLTRPWPSMLRGIYGDPERYQADLLEPLPGHVLRGRRRQARRRRLPLAARPRRRRDERVRPPHQHDRGRVGARRPPVRRGGRGRRQERPDHRPGDLRLRHPEGRRRGERRRSRPSCASTSPRSSARSPSPSS